MSTSRLFYVSFECLMFLSCINSCVDVDDDDDDDKDDCVDDDDDYD